MKSMKKVAILALACSMVVTSASVSVSAAKKVNVKKVTVESSLSGDSKTVYVAKGKTVSLKSTVTVTPDKSANKGVTYKSSNKKIATVNNKGIVKGVKTGTAKITVTSKKNKKKKATITVQVKKAAVSKVTMNQQTAALKPGDKVTLKATVKAGKNACKKVVWTTSNKKVATVTKTGVVKAVATGTATITAKAIDGSGKKATCKVTVEDSNSITAMDVLNEQTVTFSLKKAQQIAAEQIAVKTKKMQDGEYKKGLKIDSVTSPDGVNYTVVLNSNTRITKNDFVQVSIQGIEGAMEKQYKEQACAFTNERIILCTAGEYINKEFTFGEAEGYCEYAITGIPAGMTAVVKNDSVEVKGTPTTTGTTTAVMTAKDEVGNTLTQNIIFAVGSAQVIVGAAYPKYTLISGQECVIQTSGDVIGGSRLYRYQIVSDAQNTGAKLTADNDSFSISATIQKPGDYTVKVRATDEEDASRYCDIDVVLHVAQGITVEGSVKDAQGNAIKDATINFTNKNRADRYFTSYPFTINQDTGKYSAVVSSGVYDITASRYAASEAGKATEYVYNQSLTADNRDFNVSLPLYKVEFSSSDNTIQNDLKNRSWYLNNDAIGSGSEIYVKAGNYNLETDTFIETGVPTETEAGDWFNGYTKTIVTPTKTVKYTAGVNVVNAGMKVEVAKKVLKEGNSTNVEQHPAAKDTPHSVKILSNTFDMSATYNTELSNYYNAFSFEPTEDGTYELSTTGTTAVAFYNEEGKLVESVDGQYSLKKDTKYYICTGTLTRPDVKFVVKKAAVK